MPGQILLGRLSRLSCPKCIHKRTWYVHRALAGSLEDFQCLLPPIIGSLSQLASESSATGNATLTVSRLDLGSFHDVGHGPLPHSMSHLCDRADPEASATKPHTVPAPLGLTSTLKQCTSVAVFTTT